MSMRSLATGLVVAAFVVGAHLVLAPSTQAADSISTVAYEGFDYANGSSLTGANGGTGWAGPWTGGAPLQVSTPGLTYPGLTTVGGTSSWLTFVNSSNQRCLPQALNSGVVYMQFLSNFSANHGGGTPNIRLYSDNVGTLSGAIGNNNISGNNNMSILDAGLNSVAASSTPIAQLNFTIVRIDHGTNVTTMWLNPNLSTFDYLNPPAADATATGFAPSIQCILPITRNSGEFDEITFKQVVTTPDLPDQRPADVLQQVGLVTGANCETLARPDLDWSGAQGAWKSSWAEWAIPVTGGLVCTRTLFYAGGGSWGVRS